MNGRERTAGGDTAADGLATDWRPAPALLALFVQFAVLLLLVGGILFFRSLPGRALPADLALPVFGLFLCQACFAALLSRCVRMAGWWHCIHFIFPLAVWAMLYWQLPSEIYLLGFLLCLGLFWTTFRSQVPFFPSRREVRHQLEALLPTDQPLHVIDIGSGLGDLAMHLAAAHPQSTVEGIEIAPLPWLLSRLRTRLSGSTARFRYGDYTDLDFAQFDVVFAYLSPAAMPALWQKARREMREGSLLISYEFDIPGVPPTRHIPGGDAPALYLWRM